jgi:SAM-dependent methyltransferase
LGIVSDERSNAIKGFADGGRYQGARPGYPGEAVRAMVATMRLCEARLVVDVGAGTGLFTRELVPYCANIVAVEPSAGMRHEFEQQHLGVEVLAGTGESLPFPDHSVDAITVAQAFHWFDPAVALAEMRRVLVLGGHLGLIWNERDESVEWVDAMSRAMLWDKRQPYRVGMDFVPVLEEGGLVEIEVGHFRHNQLVDRATLLQRVLTTSYVSVMTEPEQRRILDDVAGVIEGFPETFELPYTTTTYCARTPGA